MFMVIEISSNAIIIMLASVNSVISVDINTLKMSALKVFVKTENVNSDIQKVANLVRIVNF